jgi:integration host factor subunit alpha
MLARAASLPHRVRITPHSPDAVCNAAARATITARMDRRELAHAARSPIRSQGSRTRSRVVRVRAARRAARPCSSDGPPRIAPGRGGQGSAGGDPGSPLAQSSIGLTGIGSNSSSLLEAPGRFMIPWGPMARMTKADIIEAVYEKVGGFSKKEAAEIVETVFNVVKETLERGEKIKISGFGNFVVRDKKDRMGRDPQRAVPILIPARRVLTFKPSQVLKNILNGLPPV